MSGEGSTPSHPFGTRFHSKVSRAERFSLAKSGPRYPPSLQGGAAHLGGIWAVRALQLWALHTLLSPNLCVMRVNFSGPVGFPGRREVP